MSRVVLSAATTVLALALAAGVRADVNPPVIAVPLDDTPAAQQDGLVVHLSPTRAGARNVVLELRLPAALRCGRPTGAVRVTLPAAAPVPASIAAKAVLVNGRAAGKVSIAVRTITVAAAGPAGITCFSIAEGRMTVRFTAAAGLANPSTPGTYDLLVRRGAIAYIAHLRIDRR